MNTDKNRPSEKRNKYGFTKEEIRENRKRLKENPTKELLIPTIEYWKEHTGRAILQLFSWIAIVYIIMVTLQAVNYDMMYCNSSLEEYNGKILRTYNPFVQHMNELVIKHHGQAPNLGKGFMLEQQDERPLPQELNQTIWCGYDLKRWWNDDSDIIHNIKEVGVYRWTKRNKDTK